MRRIAGERFGLGRRVIVIALAPLVNPKFATLAAASGMRASDRGREHDTPSSAEFVCFVIGKYPEYSLDKTRIAIKFL